MERVRMERVMITLPADLLTAVDSLARQSGRKRSQLVRQALQDLLERQQKREFEALLAEGYRELAQVVGPLASESVPLQAAAVEGVWRWDE
jgi:metal-responsive CopG/Arc/MetJ family transcriptional regulator